ncbi:TraB/GumN family protein [Vibrio mytili]|uniref:TraB/GumN family protein n=1 Tax=Vibrio mytili TaxID=50718 RepID=UPI002F41A18D
MVRLMALLSSLIVGLTSFSSFAEPQHWLVKKGSIEYMIIGSVHVGDDSMYPLPRAITNYLKTSNGLIIEADIRSSESIVYPKDSIATKMILDRAQRRELIEISKELGLSEKQLLNSPPWSTALMIQLAFVNKLGYIAENGVDMHLINQADELRIPVLSLESLQFQVDLISGQPDSGKEMLMSTLKESHRGEEMIQCLIESWRSGDDNALIEATLTDEASDEFNDAFLYSRNRDWAAKLDSGNLLPQKEGRYTVVVGSLHLVGQDNLIELLAQRGFEITPLGKTGKARCEI